MDSPDKQGIVDRTDRTNRTSGTSETSGTGKTCCIDLRIIPIGPIHYPLLVRRVHNPIALTQNGLCKSPG